MPNIAHARSPGKKKPDDNRIRYKPTRLVCYRVDRFLTVHGVELAHG